MLNMLSKTELSILQEFQERVSDLHLDPATCIRFLIAREYNLVKAEEMIRNNINWRRDVDVKKIYASESEIPTFIKEDLQYRFTGVSKNGGPVLWLPMGRWAARYWIERGKKEEVVRFSYHILESILNRIKEMNDKQCVVIFGAEELTYYKVGNIDTLKVLYTAFQALEQNYPEILQNLLVVNAPWVFTIAFNFIKPILSPRTMEKIQIYGSDKEKWLPVLRQFCLEDAIPDVYL